MAMGCYSNGSKMSDGSFLNYHKTERQDNGQSTLQAHLFRGEFSCKNAFDAYT